MTQQTAVGSTEKVDEARERSRAVRVPQRDERELVRGRPFTALGLFAIVALALAGRVGRRILAGGAAGVVAGYAMSPAQKLVGRVLSDEDEEGGGDPATVKAAELVAGTLDDDEKPRAGAIAHHAMAGTTGAIYALVDRVVPLAGWGRGLLYGATVWLVADEIAVPALGLAPAPSKVSRAVHLRGLAAHLAYGLALDTIVRVGRALRGS